MTQPERLILVAGTATDIGKTWVGGQVLSRLRADGATVAARKPAQSADADDPGPSDAAVLADATGEPVEQVCPPHRWYTVAMAPPMAAEALGLQPATLADLVAELTWPDGDAVDLAGAIDPDLVVLVADAGLGTVNSVRLGVDVFARWPVVVFLNRFDADDDLHRRNLDWLRTRERLEVVVDLEALSNRVAGGPAT